LRQTAANKPIRSPGTEDLRKATPAHPSYPQATHYANGPSIEQVLLRSTPIRGGTPVSDIHLCVADGGGGHRRHVCCYAGPGLPIQREWNPQRAIKHIFDGVSFDGSIQPRLASRRRALQVHTAELRRMQAYLSGDERERLELHVEALGDLELQLTRATSAAASSSLCQPLSVPLLTPNDHDETTVRSWSKLQIDILVQAMACDRTRVAELAFGASGSHHAGMLGLSSATRSWHEVAHMSLSDELRKQPVTLDGAVLTANEGLMRFDRLWASEVAYLAHSLAAIPEGDADGTMLDNTPERQQAAHQRPARVRSPRSQRLRHRAAVRALARHAALSQGAAASSDSERAGGAASARCLRRASRRLRFRSDFCPCHRRGRQVAPPAPPSAATPNGRLESRSPSRPRRAHSPPRHQGLCGRRRTLPIFKAACVGANPVSTAHLIFDRSS